MPLGNAPGLPWSRREKSEMDLDWEREERGVDGGRGKGRKEVWMEEEKERK